MLKEYKGAKTTANLGKNSPVIGLKPTFNSGDAGRSFYSNRKAPAGNSTLPDKSGDFTRELYRNSNQSAKSPDYTPHLKQVGKSPDNKIIPQPKPTHLLVKLQKEKER